MTKITIGIEIDGHKIELDLSDARKLIDTLNEALGKKEYIPYYPSDLVGPTRPFWYHKKWHSVSGNDIVCTGSTMNIKIDAMDTGAFADIMSKDNRIKDLLQ